MPSLLNQEMLSISWGCIACSWRLYTWTCLKLWSFYAWYILNNVYVVGCFKFCSILYNILHFWAFQIKMYSLLLTSIYVNMFETITMISLVYSYIMCMYCVALFFNLLYIILHSPPLSVSDKNYSLPLTSIYVNMFEIWSFHTWYIISYVALFLFAL